MKLLLLVQNESDVAHLDAAAKAILNSAITGVWVVFSPAITVNTSEAAAKLDAEITQLKTAEKAAAERSDYTAAAGYKTQREGKELERGKALHDAWKSVNTEERQAKTKTIFGPFIDHLKPQGLNVRITGHSDHYDREQWVAMLNSLSGVWFKEFVPGAFVVAWPEAVETSIKQRISLAGLDQDEPAPKVTVKDPLAGVGNKSRREELEGMHHMSLRPIMQKYGLDPAGKGKEKMIELILDRESKPEPAPEPALAEY